MSTQPNVMELIDQLIAQARKEGATSPQDVFDHIEARWNMDPTQSHPLLDQWGRMAVKGRMVFAPFPISEKWEGLTELQINNIRANCAVDALGRWKYAGADGNVKYVPSAFSGFAKDGLISMYPAIRYDAIRNADGTTGYKPMGYFPEMTLKTRFGSYADLNDYTFAS